MESENDESEYSDDDDFHYSLEGHTCGADESVNASSPKWHNSPSILDVTNSFEQKLESDSSDGTETKIALVEEQKCEPEFCTSTEKAFDSDPNNDNQADAHRKKDSAHNGAYIQLNEIKLSEVEAKIVYGIERDDPDNPAKIVIHKNGENGKEKKKPPLRFSKERMEELAQPRSSRQTGPKYAKESDRKNCTFRPQRSKAAQAMVTSSCEYGENDGGSTFHDRMDALERKRRKKLERDLLMAQYNARVGKKTCPSCGSEQSFDEWTERKATCPNDACGGAKYSNPTRFVLKSFEGRMEKSRRRRHETLQKIQEEQVRIRHNGKLRKSRRQEELLDKVTQRGKKSFLSRMEDDIFSRKKKILDLEDLLREKEEKNCPFQPTLNVPRQFLRTRNTHISLLVEPKHRKTDDRLRTTRLTKTSKAKKPLTGQRRQKRRTSRKQATH